MDVVKSHIEKIGGIVDVFSRPGEGTTVKLKIPLTLAIIPGLVITSGGERFVIPQVSLLELIRLEGDSREKHIERVHGTPVYRRRGSLLPIAYLNQVLGLKSAERAEAVSMVVLQAEDRQFGLVVDGINDTQEIVVKPLGKQLKGLTVYAGATIMGDGRVALILDVLGIGQRSGVLAESREQARAATEQKTQSGIEQQRLLLFRAGSFERLAVPLSLVARLEEFPQSSIEHAGGCQVVQYRNRILPLVPLRAVLESGAPDQRPGGRSGAGDRFQRRRPQRGRGGRPDPGCRRRGGHGAPEDGPQGPPRLGGGGQASRGFPRSQPGHSTRPRKIGFRARAGPRAASGSWSPKPRRSREA